MKSLKNTIPPFECVPWFEDNFNVGDNVEFLFRGSSIHFFKVSGKISEMDKPFIKINNQNSYLMGDIYQIKKL